MGNIGVLLVIDAMPRGGGPMVCFQIARALEGTRYLPCVVTLFEKGTLGHELEASGVPVLSLGLTRPFTPRCLLRSVMVICQWARRHRVALVHAHLLASGLYGIIAALCLRVPSIYTAHGELPRRIPLRVAEIIVRALAGHVVGVSRHLVRETRRYLPLIRNDRITHIYNGVDVTSWTPPPATRPGCSQQPADLTLTMVANFTREKDHRTAIEAFRLLLLTHSSSKLHLVGAGPTREELETWVEQAAIPGVIFAGEQLGIRDLLARTDIFVLSTHTEGFGIAVVEAMAMALPVVVSRVGGLQELLEDGFEGFLVPPRDPVALCEALKLLADSHQLRLSMGEKARSRVCEHFSLTSMTSAYVNLYERLTECRA